MNNNLENTVRGVAGMVLVISVLLTYFVSTWFLLLIGFVGAALFQSAFIDWCILNALVRRQDTSQCGC